MDLPTWLSACSVSVKEIDNIPNVWTLIAQADNQRIWIFIFTAPGNDVQVKLTSSAESFGMSIGSFTNTGVKFTWGEDGPVCCQEYYAISPTGTGKVVVITMIQTYDPCKPQGVTVAGNPYPVPVNAPQPGIALGTPVNPNYGPQYPNEPLYLQPQNRGQIGTNIGPDIYPSPTGQELTPFAPTSQTASQSQPTYSYAGIDPTTGLPWGEVPVSQTAYSGTMPGATAAGPTPTPIAPPPPPPAVTVPESYVGEYVPGITNPPYTGQSQNTNPVPPVGVNPPLKP